MDLSNINLGEFGRQLFLKILKETSTEGEIHDLIARCKDKQIQYTDESFPADRSSLISNWEEEQLNEEAITHYTLNFENKWKYFVWKRVSDIMDPDQMCIFKDKIEPDDIKQGVLGDCYFLSSLSVLAERPERIIELFETPEVNKYGIYALRICKNGEWRNVIVDDYFPCRGNEPAFSRAHGAELWVMLLEKAWAKVHGSYERIEAGFAENVLRDLTGAPTKVLTHDDKDLWDHMLMMAASAGATKASKKLLEEMGLIGFHSYGVLDVREVNLYDEGKERLIKLRNPWGDFEWTGDWSDQSPKWTEDLKQELDFQDEDDGTFWMSFLDFTHYFSRVQICCIEDDYKYSSYRAFHEKGDCSIIRMVLDSDAEVYLSVNQKDKRCYSRGMKYTYSNARLIVAKVLQNGALEYCYGKMGIDREIWEEYTFTAGDYLCYVEVDWQNDYINSFVLSAYSSTEAFFTRDEKSEHPDFLEKVFMSCAFKYGTKTTFEDEGDKDCIKYHQMLPEGYGYNFFCNNSKVATIKEVVTYTRFQGLELIKPFNGDGYEVLVKPQEKKIVILRQTDPSSYNLSFTFSSTILLNTEALKQRAINEGKKTVRKDPNTGEEVDISVRTLKHGGGICYYYENNTTDRTLEECIKFKLVGLKIRGHDSSEINIRLCPQQTKFVELDATSSNWRIQLSLSYGII